MYKPHRDYRFEYLFDAMDFIEENQCVSCKFKETRDEEYPMCDEISIPFINEEAIEEIDDLGDKGLVCRRYVENIL